MLLEIKNKPLKRFLQKELIY